MKYWICFCFITALFTIAWAQSTTSNENAIIAYFQPMETNNVYQYETFIDHDFNPKTFKPIKAYWVKSTEVSFVKYSVLENGDINAVYRNNIFCFNKIFFKNEFHYSISHNEISLLYVDNNHSGRLPKMDGCILKMPLGNTPIEWTTIDNWLNTHYLTAYFGNCKTRKQEYPDCIVVMDKSSDAKARTTICYYAKSIGLVLRKELPFGEKAQEGRKELSEESNVTELSKILPKTLRLPN